MPFQSELERIKIPLSFEAHAIAKSYYEAAATPQKAKQTYLNSLSIYAVNYYLNLMSIETDYSKSDSHNPIMRQLMDVADIEIKGLGKLECRSVFSGAEYCDIPSEVWADRMGYVVVEFNESLKEATILGFTPTAQAQVLLADLQSLESLLVHLSNLEQSVAQQPEFVIRLRDWIQGVTEVGWQRVEDLLSTPQMDLAFGLRNSVNISWGKTIDLGLKLEGHPLALVVTLPPEANDEMSVLMQVHPLEKMYLPEGLQLMVSDEWGVQFATQSRKTDNFIQLKFSAEMGERFQVKVVFNDKSVTQEFLT